MTSTPPEAGTDGPDQSIDAAWRQAREQAKRDVIDAVLGAGLAAVDLTTEATFKPAQRTELPGERRQLLLLVEVATTRALGTQPLGVDAAGEPPYREARAFVRDLKADGTPHTNRHDHWVSLPPELVPTLLGVAHTS